MEIQDLRLLIDRLAYHCVTIGCDGKYFYSRDYREHMGHELGECVDNLLLAKAWLGKMMGEQGIATPYGSDGKRENTGDIENADSRGDYKLGLDNSIKSIDMLREEIKKAINLLKDNVRTHSTTWIFACRDNAYTYLCNARFWLGFELERIKNVHEGKNIG